MIRPVEHADQHALLREIAQVRRCLDGSQDARAGAEPQAAEDNGVSALEHISRTFHLSLFERAVLVSVTAMELDRDFAELCAQAGPRYAYPTFDLLLSALPNAHWDALSPAAPLRARRLILLGQGETLVTSRLSVDERILHFLLGAPCGDSRLLGLCRPALASSVALPPSQALVALQAASAWRVAQAGRPILQFTGADLTVRQALASEVARGAGLTLSRIEVGLLPTQAAELQEIAAAMDREAALSGYAFLLSLSQFELLDAAHASAVLRLVSLLEAPLILAGDEPFSVDGRPTALFEIPNAEPCEQRTAWIAALGARAASLNGSLDRLSAHFNLNAESISAYSRLAAGMEDLPNAASNLGELAELDVLSKVELGKALWTTCRTQSRARLDRLAQRVNSSATWADLILPAPQMEMLRMIAAQMRHRLKVHERWGFRGSTPRGTGIAAIFSGVSGTGKTTAAEVLANELEVDLYRVDLSHTISKYIGETARNLRRIFDAAEQAGAILLFDEADALFGKRTEIRDSHDRHANTDVSYLLQRMELYRGLAILATNAKQSIDSAFLRRVRFVVQFPFPDPVMREAIWRRAVPLQAPTEALNFAQLARLSMTGGNIRNIVLNGAFAAADAGQPIRMTHLLAAAQAEAAKLERPLAENEVKGWI